MDEHALKVIDFPAILELLADRCQTHQAAEAARTLMPSPERGLVEARLRETGEARRIVDTQPPPALGEIRDVASTVDGASRGLAMPGETLYQVYETLSAGKRMRDFLLARKETAPSLARIAERAAPLPELAERIAAAVEADGEVKDHASPELASLRGKKRTLHERINERMQSLSQRLREHLSDSIITQRSGRWCLPVRSESKGRVKGIVHDTSASGATVYVEPEAVVEIGNELRTVEANERHEVARILAELSAAVGAHAEEIGELLDACTELDLIFAKARLASDMRAADPGLRDRPELVLRWARHPLIAEDTVVPVDIEVGRSFRCLLITGPNTGGKTVALKLAGLAVAMAQSGMQVPAAEAELGVFPQLWADIGDEQSLQQSLSTFSAHLRNIQRMVVGVREGALTLLDEIGAGTDPTEGAALAKAILRRLLASGALVLCSTHYGELKAYAYNTEGMQNAAMEFDVQSLRPTYRLRIGVPGASHALTIAERYGMPGDLLEDARGGLSAEEQDVSKMLDKLQSAQRDAERAQEAAEARRKELEAEHEELRRKIAKADEARRKAADQAETQIDEIRRAIRQEADQLFERLKQVRPAGKEEQRIREELRELDRVAMELSEEVAPKPVREKPPREPRKGDKVRVGSVSQPGTVLADPEGDKVSVRVGGMRMSVAVSEVEVMEEAPSEPKRPRRASGTALKRVFDISPELHLRRMRAEEALETLERYLDDAVLAGLDKVRVVHGKGAGILRGLVHERLRTSPVVSSFHLADHNEGGDGVTIVEFRR